MKKNVTLSIDLLTFLGAIIIVGQDDIQTPNGQRLPTTPEQARNRDFENRLRAMNHLMNQKPVSSRARIKTLSKEERKRFEEATTPSADIKLKYKNFLRQSNTGAFRLIPNFECQTENLIKVDGDCAGFVPDAWAYSFRSEYYSGKDFQDIGFENGKLVTDGLLNQGILVDLGNDSVETIGLDHPGFPYLSNFVPAEDRTGAALQFRELSAGIRSGDFYYSNSVQLEVGNTYGFRNIAYRYGDKRASRFRGRNYEKLSKKE